METQDLTVSGNNLASPAMDLFPESEFDLTNSMNSVLIVRMLNVLTINMAVATHFCQYSICAR